MALAVLAGSEMLNSGGSIPYPAPAGWAAGMELEVTLLAVAGPLRVNLVCVDSTPGTPATLAFTAVAAIYDPLNGLPEIRSWKRKLTGAEVFPLNFSNEDGGSATAVAWIVSGQHATASTEGWDFDTKPINGSPFVAKGATPSLAGSLLVHIMGTDNGLVGFVPPAAPPVTPIVSADGGPGGYVVAAYRALATAGVPSGTTSFPFAGANGGNMVTFILRPAAAATDNVDDEACING